jgi:hypothetical protein
MDAVLLTGDSFANALLGFDAAMELLIAFTALFLSLCAINAFKCLVGSKSIIVEIKVNSKYCSLHCEEKKISIIHMIIEIQQARPAGFEPATYGLEDQWCSNNQPLLFLFKSID